MPDPNEHRLLLSLRPTNFLSFGPDFPGIDLRGLNVLIGPNGSGKSNLIEAVSFMRASAAARDFRDVTMKGGGVSEWIWKGSDVPRAEVEIAVNPPGEEEPLTHRVQFTSFGQSFVLADEQILKGVGSGKDNYFYNFRHGNPILVSADGKKQLIRIESIDIARSILLQRRDPENYPQLAWLTRQYEKVCIYREWGFGRNAHLRTPQAADMRNDVLREDFLNLGLFLSRLKKSPKAKRVIIEYLQKLYEGLTDFEIVAEGGTVQIFLHEDDFSIPATRLSDGTLRYLCLLAVLCDPTPPPLICIEEPELGLHPDIIPTIADLLKSASERTQLIVTTHSDILVDCMSETPENVVICEKSNGKTEMKRLAAGELSVWLEKYRLGQLWIQGEIGGTRW